MTSLRTAAIAAALTVALPVLLSGDVDAVGVDAPPASAWAEIKWPFLLDQWGTGRAFRCAPSDCGATVDIYMRAKIGFCNCATGITDDDELDRVGDVSLIGDRFSGTDAGAPVTVGWMTGRSRRYAVEPPYKQRQQVLAVAFNDKCDVIVATVAAGRDLPRTAEQAALAFLNGDEVLQWARSALGI